MIVQLNSFEKTFEFLVDDVRMEPSDAAHALASANVGKDHQATWYESPGYPIRALKRLTGVGPDGHYEVEV
jgi:hypothetical protein